MAKPLVDTGKQKVIGELAPEVKEPVEQALAGGDIPTTETPNVPEPSGWTPALRYRLSGRERMPEEVGRQIPVPWYHPAYDSIMRGEVYEPATPVRYADRPTNVNQIPDVKSIYRKYNVPISDSKQMLNARNFMHNIPLTIWTDDNRIIRARTPEEFALLLWYFAQPEQMGIDNDPETRDPTQNYSFSDIKRAEDGGDYLTAQRMMEANVKAGNITHEQFLKYMNGATSDDIYKETNGKLGTFNRNPVYNPIKYINASDYIEWANNVSLRRMEPEVRIASLSRIMAVTRGVILQAMANNKAERESWVKGGEFRTLEDYNAPPKLEFPTNWEDWDLFDEKYRVMKGGKPVPLPGEATYSIKQVKTQLLQAITDLETEIDGKLPSELGLKSKVYMPDLASDFYEVRFIKDGIELDGNLNPIDSGQEITFEWDDQLAWPAINYYKERPDYYKAQMWALAQRNPNLARSWITKAHPELNKEMVDAFIETAQRDATVTLDQNETNAIIQKYGNLARIDKWQQFMQLFPDFAEKSQETEAKYKWHGAAIKDFIVDPGRPDAAKDLLFDMISPVTAGLEQLGNIMGLIDDIVRGMPEYGLTPTETPYKIWKEERPLPVRTQEELTGIGAAVRGTYGLTQPITETPTRGELQSWTNPLWYIGGAEAKAALTGGEWLVARAAAMLAGGKGRAAVLKYVVPEAAEIGVKAVDVVNDAEKLVKNTMDDTMKSIQRGYEQQTIAGQREQAELARSKGVLLPENEGGMPGKFTEGQPAQVQRTPKPVAESGTAPPVKPVTEGAQVAPTEVAGQKTIEGMPKPIESTGPIVPSSSRLLDRYGDAYSLLTGDHNKMNIADNFGRAEQLLKDNVNEARMIAYAFKSAPANITPDAVTFAYANHLIDTGAVTEGNMLIQSLLYRRTGTAQNLVSLRGIINGTERPSVMKAAMEQQRTAAAKKLKVKPEKLDQEVAHEVQKIKDAAKKTPITKEQLKKSIDDNICPP